MGLLIRKYKQTYQLLRRSDSADELECLPLYDSDSVFDIHSDSDPWMTKCAFAGAIYIICSLYLIDSMFTIWFRIVVKKGDDWGSHKVIGEMSKMKMAIKFSGLGNSYTTDCI